MFDPGFVRDESRRAYRMACILFWSMLLFFVFQRYVVSLGVVKERSMLPTLLEGNYFLVNQFIYHVTRPEQGDVVVLRRNAYIPDQDVKRVIGRSGDLLLIRSGIVYVNGRQLIEPYTAGGTFPDFGPFRVEDGFYFVMGDNRAESKDSREFGSVPLRAIKGRITPGKLFSFF